LYVLALLTIASPAAAQVQTPPQEEAVAQPTEEVADTAELQTTDAVAAPEAETAVAESDADDAEATKADFQLATRQYRACRTRAMGQGGVTAVSSQCVSQRKRMLSAKEALRGG
jgi:hypothetical protein